ncbi:hypothetical protein BJI67_16280 (plasmid) [Acidihalobacter aeolianus]|uniref:DUF3150 domain-containing protein n=1 Tax=Acidihalobacter aeolianus TaxID=2792603 RepID=A0A1D8KCV6_9GAMM|nr:DUF3150 domain-containing protein [Acidihalobacter aeolianus]AOV18795.1 hypothetical protein BJI67_16280 [Acidihalobacter aeolianus]
MKLTLIDPVLTGITGTTALDTDDIGGIAVPPELVSLGVKRWISKADLRFIKKNRQAVLRVMRRTGIAFGSVYIIPDENLAQCKEELDVIMSQLNSERDELAQDIDRKVDEWASLHPDWENKIRAAALTGVQIRERIKMTVREYPIEIELATDGAGTDVSKGASPMLDGLDGQLAMDVRALVKDGWTSGRSKTNRRSLRVLERIRNKLNTLNWIAPGMSGAAVAAIDDFLNQLPKTGPIEGGDFVRLESLMNWLSDPTKLLSGERSEDDDQVIGFDDEEIESGDDPDCKDENPAPPPRGWAW